MRLKIIQKISNIAENNKLIFSASSTGPECNPLVPNNLAHIKHKLEELIPDHVTIPDEFFQEFNKLVATERKAVEDRRQLILRLQEEVAPQIQQFLEDFPSLYPELLL
jgi:hypothetical protein